MMDLNKVTPEGMTKIVTGNYKEISFDKSEADDWLREIGKRIGNSLHFKTYRFMKERYQFIVGIFDENENILVSGIDRHKWFVPIENEVHPTYIGFYVGSGTMWDMEPNQAKMDCLLHHLTKQFYIDYSVEILNKKSMLGEFGHYVVSGGKLFNPIPDASTIGGLVLNMDMMKYGKYTLM